jgi:hypothetical protein
LQGDNGSGPNKYLKEGHIVAEAKHFGGYGASSKDGAPVEISMGLLHDIYLRPWKAFAKAGGRALMASHNDINGRPCHSNPLLLTQIMREDFGFGDALIASDGHDVNRVYYTGTVRVFRQKFPLDDAIGPTHARFKRAGVGPIAFLSGVRFSYRLATSTPPKH